MNLVKQLPSKINT